MKKNFTLLAGLSVMLASQVFGQTSTVYLTTSGGSYPSEKWVSITDGPNGTGNVIWDQGAGTYGANAGLLSNEPITITDGMTYYINCYDAYADGWDGTIYELRDAMGGSGTLIANNTGASPSDGTDTDASGSFEPGNEAAELESSEMFSYTPPSCPQPTALTVTNLTATSADFGWTDAGGSEWEVVYGTAGFTPVASGTSTINNPEPSGTLAHSTDYEFYVRTICGVGDTSAWSGPFAFSTPCMSETIPWMEDFEGLSSTGTTVFPSCWFKENGDWQSSDNGGSSYDADALSGSYFIRNRYGATDEYIWTPGFDLVAGESYDFTFWWAGDGYSGWDGDVFVNTDQSSTGATQIGGSFVTSASATDMTYRQELYRFQAPTTGTYYFAIRVNANFNPWDLSFDDFGLDMTPPCPDPENLVSTWFDNDSVIVEWDPGYLETDWVVELGASGFTPGTSAELYSGNISTDPTDTIGGLDQITDYDVYVMADCGGGDMSAWVGPVSFTTLPNCAAPTGFTVNVISPDSVELDWTPGSTGETEWTIEYGMTGFTQGSGTYVSVNGMPNDTIGMLMQNTAYDFYLLGNCSATDSSLWVGPVSVTTPLFCNNVGGLSATVVTDTAFLSWTAGIDGETEWNVEYGPAGFTLGTGTMYTTTNNNPDTLVGLDPSGIYDFYVQAACAGGDTSEFTGPYSFAMPLGNDDACDAIELPVDGMSRAYTSTGSTSQGEPINGSGGSSVWFYFVHPNTQGVTASLCGSGFDTKIYGFEYGVCGDFSTYTELNYNDDYTPCGLQSQIELCGTPGDTIAIMVDGFSGASGNFLITLSEINLNAGTDGMMDVCASDTIDLNSVASTNAGGMWMFDLNPAAIAMDSMFIASSVPAGTHEATYIVQQGCAMDSAMATLNIVAPGNSGTAISPFMSCNTDVYLPDGLEGTVEAGGTWLDDSGTGLLAGPNGNVFVAAGVPNGTYPFTYQVDNGVCPAAETTVQVVITNCAGVEENNFEVSLYPNPNDGSFFMLSDVTGESTVKITDISGKVVYNNVVGLTAGTPFEINLNNVEAGMYMVSVTNASGTNVTNVMIK